jgi:hypothetical protein
MHKIELKTPTGRLFAYWLILLVFSFFCLIPATPKKLQAKELVAPTQVAQANDSDETYDPFIDYNEYEVADEEEADVNFFIHGRQLTAGFVLGQRSYTDEMGQLLKPDAAYGLFLSYFFDMRLALQFSYTSSTHALSVTTNDPSPITVTGEMKSGSTSMDLKYYFNTQNITKGLAKLNPYFLGGFSSISRQWTVTGHPEFASDSAIAFDLAAGLELPMMQNRMYFGAQALYQVVNFPGESSQVLVSNTRPTGKHLRGDPLTVFAILGINF